MKDIPTMATDCAETMRDALNTIADVGPEHAEELINAVLVNIATYLEGLASLPPSFGPRVLETCITLLAFAGPVGGPPAPAVLVLRKIQTFFEPNGDL